MKHIFLYALFILGLSSSPGFAQQAVQSSVDTLRIKIGGELQLILKTTTDQSSRVIFPETQSIGAFEVIQSHAIDTIIKQNQYELIKKYSLTQFDSGSYTLPAVPVIIDNKAFPTDSFSIAVLGVTVDTLKQPLYDIKPVSSEGAGMASQWYYYLALLLIVLTAIGLYLWIGKRQNKDLTEDDLFKTPYEKAAKKLKKLEAKKLWVRGETKTYYSDMTDIARDFIEETFGIPARELTTFELIKLLKQTLASRQVKIEKKVIDQLMAIFKTADLVKFAKSQPEEFEIIADTTKINKVITDINTAFPLSEETQTEQIRLRERRKKQRRNIRTWVPIAVATLLLMCTGIVYLVNHTQAGALLKSFSFNSSKRLLNKEWIKSTYGNPGLSIETPNVLTRMHNPTLAQTLPTGVLEANQFASGQITDAVQVLLNTIRFEKEMPYNKEEIVKHSLQIITQNLQARNLEFKTETFENANGLNGIKALGTFVVTHPIKKQDYTLYFELVSLQQENSAQQLGVFYEKSDAVGTEIAQRVFDSIQFKTEDK